MENCIQKFHDGFDAISPGFCLRATVHLSARVEFGNLLQKAGMTYLCPGEGTPGLHDARDDETVMEPVDGLSKGLCTRLADTFMCGDLDILPAKAGRFASFEAVLDVVVARFRKVRMDIRRPPLSGMLDAGQVTKQLGRKQVRRDSVIIGEKITGSRGVPDRGAFEPASRPLRS